MQDSFNNKHFYAKYGNEEYSLKVSMYNTEYVTYLQRNSIVYLEIEDNIFNPFHTANLVIGNDQNVIEKAPNPFVFFGNGRDILDIEIIPLINNDIDRDSTNEENKEYLGLKFSFVITESIDVVYNNSVCKKLKLVEYAQYMLSENICNIFGIQRAGASVGNYMETNGGNSKSTGDVIKSILWAVFTNEKQSDDIFYVDKKTNQKIFDFQSETKVSINPYGVVSYMEVLNYVLSFHSFEKSPCILNFDRYQKKFILISLKRLFEENKKYLIETIRFPSFSQNPQFVEQEKPNNYAIQWEIFPITFEESKINQYYNEAPTCKYNVDLAGNSGITSTSRSFKSMVFNFKTLNSDTFMKTFYDLFVKPFKDNFSKQGGDKFEVLPNFYPNPNKKNNYDAFKGYLTPELDENKFLNQKLSTLLYLNNVYQFKLTGKTHRKSMSFIDVVKTAENTDGGYKATKWDMNTLGRHLVTSVKHIFSINTYHNEIETIKPYRLVDKDDGEMSLEDFLKENA
jgi:hypothetical protein